MSITTRAAGREIVLNANVDFVHTTGWLSEVCCHLGQVCFR